MDYNHGNLDEFRKPLPEVTIMDNVFMQKFFEGRLDLVEQMLQIILKDDTLKVERFEREYIIASLQNKSVRIDICVIDDNSTRYALEIQNDSSDANPQRAIHILSVLVSNLLEKGGDPKNLPEVYVIFLTKGDPLRSGLQLNHFKFLSTITGDPLWDGVNIIYINTSIQDDTELGKLLHDLRTPDPDEMYLKSFAERARYFKENEKGVTEMCNAIQALCDKYATEGEARGEAKGEAKAKIAFIKNLYKSDMKIPTIASMVDESEETVQKIIEEYEKEWCC